MALVKYRPRTRRRSSMTRRAALRTFARSKRQWVVPFASECESFYADPSVACPNGAVINLVPNEMLNEQFEDAVDIVRITGDIWFRPVMPFSGSSVTDIINSLRQNTLMRIGLSKDTQTTSQPAPQAKNPMNSGDVPIGENGDYAEGKWLRLWQHYWEPTPGLVAQQAQKSCVPIITGGSSAIVNGTTWAVTEGAINTAISTEVVCCDPTSTCESDPYGLNVSLVEVRPWRLRLNIKRRLRLKDADSLNLWFGWENLDPTGGVDPRRPQPQMHFWGGVRMLVEK